MGKANCELCSSTSNLNAFKVAPKSETITICETCKKQIENPATMDPNHWRSLSESMWSEVPAVQVMSWRALNQLKKAEGWAQDLFEQLYLDDELLKWAESNPLAVESESDDTKPTKDSNGAALLDGDSVTLIKDLDVKGASFTAKRGTLVKNTSLTNNPEHIEGRVNGTQIVILTCFVKKA